MYIYVCWCKCTFIHKHYVIKGSTEGPWRLHKLYLVGECPLFLTSMRAYFFFYVLIYFCTCIEVVQTFSCQNCVYIRCTFWWFDICRRFCEFICICAHRGKKEWALPHQIEFVQPSWTLNWWKHEHTYICIYIQIAGMFSRTFSAGGVPLYLTSMGATQATISENDPKPTFPGMYVCICVYVRVCVCACVCMDMYMYMCVNIYMYVYLYVCIFIGTCLYVYI